jgi:hypothetical protein
VETVEGSGCVVLLLSSLQSLTQLYTLTMDVHSRLRTEAHADVTGGCVCVVGGGGGGACWGKGSKGCSWCGQEPGVDRRVRMPSRPYHPAGRLACFHLNLSW